MPKNNNKPRKGKSCKKLKKPRIEKFVGGHSHKVSFNLRKNHVEKFYCPNLPSQKSEDFNHQIDLDSIEDFPEIPLTDLVNIS